MLEVDSIEGVRDFFKNISEDKDKVDRMSREDIIKEYKYIFGRV